MQRMKCWIPRRDRQRASLIGSVGLSDGRAMAVFISDTSQEGCQVHARESLPIGEVILLHCRGRTSVRASVRWSLDGVAGLRFLTADAPSG